MTICNGTRRMVNLEIGNLKQNLIAHFSFWYPLYLKSIYAHTHCPSNTPIRSVCQIIENRSPEHPPVERLLKKWRSIKKFFCLFFLVVKFAHTQNPLNDFPNNNNLNNSMNHNYLWPPSHPAISYFQFLLLSKCLKEFSIKQQKINNKKTVLAKCTSKRCSVQLILFSSLILERPAFFVRNSNRWKVRIFDSESYSILAHKLVKPKLNTEVKKFCLCLMNFQFFYENLLYQVIPDRYSKKKRYP